MRTDVTVKIQRLAFLLAPSVPFFLPYIIPVLDIAKSVCSPARHDTLFEFVVFDMTLNCRNVMRLFHSNITCDFSEYF